MTAIISKAMSWQIDVHFNIVARLVTVVSVQASLSNSHQAVPSAVLVVWTQDLWSY